MERSSPLPHKSLFTAMMRGGMVAALMSGAIPAEEMAPLPKRPQRSTSKRRRNRRRWLAKAQSWNSDTPPVVQFGIAANRTLKYRGKSIGPKRRRRLVRAVASLEAFHAKHKDQA